jgi:uncharacterized delta-60 repeat protein
MAGAVSQGGRQMNVSRAGMVTFLAALGTLAGVPAAHAAAGSLDPGFGSGGIVTTSYSGPFPADAALQPDGKIVVIAGFDNTPSATEAFGVLRYQGNGALDTSFGTGGRASANFTNFLNSPNDVALQSDGKIVVAGNAQSADGTVSEFAVARFNANGTPDGSFGAGAKVTTNFVGVMAGGVSNPAESVLIQADGKILVGGLASQCARRCPAPSALARYNSNGSLDTTFGSGGKVAVTAIGGITALAEDAAGHIFALNGASTAEFSAAGVLQAHVTPSPITIASSRGGASSVFQADGKYLAISSGAGFSRHDIDAKIVRYLPTGAADTGFANPAFDFTADNTVASDAVQALAVQPNGQIIAAGLHSAGGSTAFGVARLNSGGSLDTTFGTGGTLITNLPGGGQATVVLIQPDGKILVIRQGFIPGGGVTLILARYLAQ